MIDDLRFAIRLYARNGRAVSVVVLGLGMAVGLSTALFATVRILTDKTIDLPSKKQLRWIRIDRDRAPALLSTHPTIADLRAAESAIGPQWIAGSLSASARLEHGTHILQAPQPVRFVSAGFFDVTGGAITIGRPLTPADQAETVAAPVVMSHGMWRREFDADANVLGQVMVLNGRPFTVVGVAAAGFAGPEPRAPAFWAPLGAFEPQWRDGGRLSEHAAHLEVLTKLGPTTTESSRLAALSSVIRAPVRLEPVGDTDGFREATIVSAAAMGLVIMVLLLGCANVATLLAASNADRRAEFATRAALGASGRRLWRQLMAEGLLLGVAGGALGLVVALWAGRLIIVLVELPPSIELLADGPFLGFGLAAALASGVIASVMPAYRASHTNLRSSLDSHTASSHRTGGVRTVAGQAALCVVVVGLAGLLVRGASRATHAELGYDSDPILITTAISRAQHSDAESRARAALAENLPGRLRGIERVALAQGAAFGGSSSRMSLMAGGRAIPTYIKRTSPAFAATVGLPIVRGRYLNAADMAGGPPAIVISALLARAGWGEQEAVGADAGQLHPSLRGTVVVGVAADVVPHQFEDIGRATAVYLPLRAEDYRFASLFIRSEGDAAIEPAALREALRQLLPQDTPGVLRLSAEVAGSRQRAQVPARIAMIAGLTVLTLAAIGLGGVTTTLVRQRRRDFAIHLALGASPARVRMLVFRHGLLPVATGLVVGLALAVPLAHWMRILLYGISPIDPIALSSSAAVLFVVTIFAMLGPARMAGRINPSEALKE